MKQVSLKKAMEAYSNYSINADGYYIKESDMPFHIEKLLKKHHPDILVITGHDAYDGKEIKNLGSYRTSKYFIDAINIARTYQSNKDGLAIIAGACIDPGPSFEKIRSVEDVATIINKTIFIRGSIYPSILVSL